MPFANLDAADKQNGEIVSFVADPKYGLPGPVLDDG
jgi:hypothetical protein